VGPEVAAKALATRSLIQVYRLNYDELHELFLEVKRLEQMFKRVTDTHVPRTNQFIRRLTDS